MSASGLDNSLVTVATAGCPPELMVVLTACSTAGRVAVLPSKERTIACVPAQRELSRSTCDRTNKHYQKLVHAVGTGQGTHKELEKA